MRSSLPDPQKGLGGETGHMSRNPNSLEGVCVYRGLL